MLDEGGERLTTCFDCYNRSYTPTTSSQYGSSFKPLPSQDPHSSQFLGTRPRGCQLPPRVGRGHADPAAANRLRQANLDAFNAADPVLDLSTDDWRDNLALTERDYDLFNDFHKKPDKEQLQTCSCCQEKWFHMGLNEHRICSSCQKADNDINEDLPYLYSAANDMDPGPLPPGLELLTQIEEMLIARVHCFVEVRQVRGVQYKYKGHTVNFLTNTLKVYNRLPLLPQDVDVIVVRPANWNKDPRMRRQFRGDFRVRKPVVKAWLEHLKRHHPAYRDIEIAYDNLDALGDDFFADDELIVHEIEDEELINASAIGLSEEEEEPEVGAVPDLQGSRNEVDAISTQLQSQGARRFIRRQPRRLPSMSMPTPQQTPISEYQRTQPTLSLAFPSLYPYGRAEHLTPRPREVKFTDYVRHMMLYRDMRFAQHPRFRYVAFNPIMRHQINEKAGFFVRKMDPQNKDLTLDDLRNAFNDDSEESRYILNRVTRYAASLRGTRPYWGGRMKMVESMVRMLGCPHLFLTFSAADLHWDSLMQHMPRYDEWKATTSVQRVRIARDNLRDNPHIVAYHFYRRLYVFIDVVLRAKFNIQDYFNRFEWQARGSSHNHGLYWCDGAPEPRDLAISEEARQVFAKFWGIHVTAFNPEPDSGALPATEDSTIQAPGVELGNTGCTLSSTVNRVQGHTCTKTYCLRINKTTRQEECRFLLPDEHRDEAKVAQHPYRTYMQYYPMRNDGYLNKYNRLTTMAWQANTDVSPRTSLAAVLEHIVKYAIKPEVLSLSYRQMAEKIIPFVNEARPYQSMVTKLMNKLIGERDYSAQEVCHMLLNLKLSQGTRDFITVDLRHPDQHPYLYRVEAGETRRGLSLLEHYMQRPENIEDVSYYAFLRSHGHRAPYNLRIRSLDRILNYFSRYRPYEVEDYGHAKLMIHHPSVFSMGRL
jgi:ATP-dependent DNA helicase PIF1